MNFQQEYEISFSRLPSNLIQLFLERNSLDARYTEDVNYQWILRQKDYYERTSTPEMDEFFLKAVGQGKVLPKTSRKEEKKKRDYETAKKKKKMDLEMILN